MRAYTLAMLDKLAGQGHPIVETGIIEWANNKVFLNFLFRYNKIRKIDYY
jgi:hypothetical protein